MNHVQKAKCMNHAQKVKRVNPVEKQKENLARENEPEYE